jgi:TonB family protein
MRTVLPLLLLAGVALADAPRVYRIEDGVSPPRVVSKTAPDYTDEARLARLTGNVTVKLIVDEDGSVRDLDVTKPLGMGLDQKAIEAVKSWQFAPGTVDGKPVAVLTSVSVNFQLLTARSDWKTTRVFFDGPARDLINADFPSPAGPEEFGAVTLDFDINSDGVPDHIEVQKSTDPKWNSEVSEILRGWRFEPGYRSHCTIDFTRGKSST